MRTRSTAAAVIAASALLAGATATSVASAASEPPAAGGSITVGSADFPENELLANIYGQALEAAGFDVSYEVAIGSREIYYPAVESGEIDLLPEYTNSLLAYITEPDAAAANVDEQIALLGENLPEGLEVLTPSTAEDKDVIACTQEVVDQHDLVDLTSLAAASAEITLGAPPEFEERSPWGLQGFADILGASFAEFVPLSYGDIPAALESGAIDCGNVFSTSSAVTTGGFVLLDDDAGLVPGEFVVPLIRSEVATPEAVAALDAVSAALDTDILKELVAEVEVEATAPAEVAAEWLASDPQPVDVPGDSGSMAPGTSVPASSMP